MGLRNALWSSVTDWTIMPAKIWPRWRGTVFVNASTSLFLQWRLSEMSDHLYRSQFISLQGINRARFYWKLSAFRFTDIWVELVPLISQMGTELLGRNAEIKNKSWWSNPAKLFQNNHFKDLERRFVLSRSTSMRGSAIKPNFIAKYAWRPDLLSV